MSVDELQLHAIEVVLRDSRNMGVIMALNRLTIEPSTQDELHRTMRDMDVVRSFIQDNVPDSLKTTAAAMFAEHAQKVQRHFLGASAARAATERKD
jgi:hypothetical protein